MATFDYGPHIANLTYAGLTVDGRASGICTVSILLTDEGSSQPLDAEFDASLNKIFSLSNTNRYGWGINFSGLSQLTNYRAWVQLSQGGTRTTDFVDTITLARPSTKREVLKTAFLSCSAAASSFAAGDIDTWYSGLAARLQVHAPSTLTLLGDTPYAERGVSDITYTANAEIEDPYVVFPSPTSGDWKPYFTRMFQALYGAVPGYKTILESADNVRYIPSDHDIFFNDFDHSLTSLVGGYLSSQEDINNLFDCFIEVYDTLVSGNLEYDENTPGLGNIPINNPSHIDGAGSAVPRWLFSNGSTGVEDSANPGNYLTNTDYAGAVPSEATLAATGNYDARFWREGWRFNGERNDSDPHVECFFLQGQFHRDRVPLNDGATPYTVTAQLDPPDTDTGAQTRTMLGAPQVAWLKDKLVSSPAIYKVVCFEKLAWFTSPGLLNNTDGSLHYSTEWADIFSHLAANGVRGLIFVAGDFHRPFYVSISPDTDVNFPNGFTNIIASPTYNVRVNIGVWADDPAANTPAEIFWLEGFNNPDIYGAAGGPPVHTEIDFSAAHAKISTYADGQLIQTAYLAPDTNYLTLEEPVAMTTHTITFTAGQVSTNAGISSGGLVSAMGTLTGGSTLTVRPSFILSGLLTYQPAAANQNIVLFDTPEIDAASTDEELFDELLRYVSSITINGATWVPTVANNDGTFTGSYDAGGADYEAWVQTTGTPTPWHITNASSQTAVLELVPLTFYLSTSGSDSNFGLANDAAWLTLDQANTDMLVGDTLEVVDSGVYSGVYLAAGTSIRKTVNGLELPASGNAGILGTSSGILG